MMPGLQIKGLRKRLGDHQAVDDLSFSVEDAEFFVILGPSGCGKSTTLRIICGLEQPDAGEVVIAGRDVTTLPSRQRNLGMVFQEYGLYPTMDVFGNMAYGLQARGKVSRPEIERRITEAAGKLGLTDLLSKPITDLSGGEQQRVALGRAMVKDADAYLFDEPLSNLDPKLRHRVRRDIMAMHRDKKRPTVYVTHDQAEAFAMADRIAVMNKGVVAQVGSADELVDDPANVFVAQFVGSPPMNLVPADLATADTGFVARTPDATLPLPESAVLQGYSERTVTVGIRPDAFTLHSRNDHGSITAEVVDIEPLITETVVRLRTAGDISLAAVFRDGEEDALTIGNSVVLDVDPGRLRLFHSVTERALT
jgi:ABC-type sugar transport system ATPase subunit